MSADKFLGDPVLDRMMKIILSLSQEVYVLRDRLGIIEHLMDEKQMISRADIEGYQPDESSNRRLLEERDAFIERLLSPLIDGDEGAQSDRA